MAKDAYYFSHDSNAKDDPKMLSIRMAFGWAGYGLAWAMIEDLRNSENFTLEVENIKQLAFSYNTDITLLQDIYNNAIKSELFKENDGKFWSPSLTKRMDKMLETRKKKSEAGKKGMASRYSNTVITQSNKGKESKVNESKPNIKGNIKYRGVELDGYMAFNEFVILYPNKYGEIQAKDDFLETIINQQKWDELLLCLANYRKTEHFKNNKIMNLSNFITNHKDYREPDTNEKAAKQALNKSYQKRQNTSTSKKVAPYDAKCFNCNDPYISDGTNPDYCQKCDKIIKEMA